MRADSLLAAYLHPLRPMPIGCGVGVRVTRRTLAGMAARGQWRWQRVKEGMRIHAGWKARWCRERGDATRRCHGGASESVCRFPRALPARKKGEERNAGKPLPSCTSPATSPCCSGACTWCTAAGRWREHSGRRTWKAALVAAGACRTQLEGWAAILNGESIVHGKSAC
jgi:hypothetical protein